MFARYALLIITAAGLLGGTYAFWISSNDQRSAEAAYEAAAPATRDLVIPALSEVAQAGRAAFNGRCATCHGTDALGGLAGPPLIHKIYEPSHHGDEAFRAAVAVGVRQHHWKFGPMPPQPGVTLEQVEAIIAYVRETQRANGIF